MVAAHTLSLEAITHRQKEILPLVKKMRTRGASGL
jgi:hypothetical protein